MKSRDIDPQEILATPRITKVTHRAYANGAWTCGTIAGHRFEALTFPAHALNQSYEIGDSRISKLWVGDPDNRQVYCWDRGLYVSPQTPLAAAIVDVLTAGLSETVWGQVIVVRDK